MLFDTRSSNAIYAVCKSENIIDLQIYTTSLLFNIQI